MGQNLPKTIVKSANSGSDTAKDYIPSVHSDTVDQPEFRGFVVTVGGSVTITSSNKNTISFPVVDGEKVPIGGVRIGLATTATGISLLY